MNQAAPNMQMLIQQGLNQYAAQSSLLANARCQNQQGSINGALGNNRVLGSGLMGFPSAIKHELVRYEVTIDEMVPVTQQWVDDVNKSFAKLTRERDEAVHDLELNRARVTDLSMRLIDATAKLEAATPVKQEPIFDFNRAWNRTEKARSAFGGM